MPPTGAASKTENRPQRTNAVGTTIARSRSLPRGGTYIETENGTLIWGRSIDLITQACQQVCMSSSAPAAVHTTTNAGGLQKKPISAETRRRMSQAQRRRQQSGSKASQPKTMAAGGGGNS